MKRRHSVAVVAVVVAAGVFGLLAAARPVAAAAPASFQEDVLPVFVGRCVSCHSAPNGEGFHASGLDLTSYQSVMAGTRFGPMIVPGDPDGSNLMRLLDWRVSPQLRMPHSKKQLSSCDRNAIRAWIREGAKNN